jgi:hypothetical protein
MFIFIGCFANIKSGIHTHLNFNRLYQNFEIDRYSMGFCSVALLIKKLKNHLYLNY